MMTSVAAPHATQMHYGKTPRQAQHTQCRLSAQSLETMTIAHGDWQGIEHAGWLQADVDELNDEYQGKIRHWLEYQ